MPTPVLPALAAVELLWERAALRQDLGFAARSAQVGRVRLGAARPSARPEVRVRIAGVVVQIWCAPAAAADQAYASQGFLAIGHAPLPEGVELPKLGRFLDALLGRWRARLKTVPEADKGAWLARASLVELLDAYQEAFAVAVGLKPAARLLLRPVELAEWQARVARHGLLSETVDLPDFVGSFHTRDRGAAARLFYVAREPSALRRAAAAERAQVTAASRASAEPLGAALGYPPCCVAAYEARPGWSVQELLQAAAAACEATPPAVMALSHDGSLLLGSHIPCRLDCPATAAQAEALLRAIAEISPARARGAVSDTFNLQFSGGAPSRGGLPTAGDGLGG